MKTKHWTQSLDFFVFHAFCVSALSQTSTTRPWTWTNLSWTRALLCHRLSLFIADAAQDLSWENMEKEAQNTPPTQASSMRVSKGAQQTSRLTGIIQIWNSNSHWDFPLWWTFPTKDDTAETPPPKTRKWTADMPLSGQKGLLRSTKDLALLVSSRVNTTGCLRAKSLWR